MRPSHSQIANAPTIIVSMLTYGSDEDWELGMEKMKRRKFLGDFGNLCSSGICGCVHVYCVCVCVCVCCVCTYVCACACVCTYMCVHACLFAYICVYSV